LCGGAPVRDGEFEIRRAVGSEVIATPGREWRTAPIDATPCSKVDQRSAACHQPEGQVQLGGDGLAGAHADQRADRHHAGHRLLGDEVVL
jgi:hypothetical protein